MGMNGRFSTGGNGLHPAWSAGPAGVKWYKPGAAGGGLTLRPPRPDGVAAGSGPIRLQMRIDS